ncbi:MAG TPA: hypothetical protein VFX58_20140 [Chitinophagaceae bacterium]|nr:hypothetical protein [Chitinophagaceae bacterium]
MKGIFSLVCNGNPFTFANHIAKKRYWIWAHIRRLADWYSIKREEEFLK